MKIFVLPLQAVLTTGKLSCQILSTFLLFVLRSFRRLQVGRYMPFCACADNLRNFNYNIISIV